jgi:hypothetical protein
VKVYPIDVRGTLNGIHLDRITSITTEAVGNSTLTTLRGIESPALENLKVNTPARLILADGEIKGVLVAYAADGHGYRITIESSSPD